MTRKEIGHALNLFMLGDTNDDVVSIANALAWYALERAAHEFVSLEGGRE